MSYFLGSLDSSSTPKWNDVPLDVQTWLGDICRLLEEDEQQVDAVLQEWPEVVCVYDEDIADISMIGDMFAFGMLQGYGLKDRIDNQYRFYKFTYGSINVFLCAKDDDSLRTIVSNRLAELESSG